MDHLNRWVFSLWRKIGSFGADAMPSHILFQTWGPTTGKARLLSWLLRVWIDDYYLLPHLRIVSSYIRRVYKFYLFTCLLTYLLIYQQDQHSLSRRLLCGFFVILLNDLFLSNKCLLYICAYVCVTWLFAFIDMQIQQAHLDKSMQRKYNAQKLTHFWLILRFSDLRYLHWIFVNNIYINDIIEILFLIMAKHTKFNKRSIQQYALHNNYLCNNRTRIWFMRCLAIIKHHSVIIFSINLLKLAFNTIIYIRVSEQDPTSPFHSRPSHFNCQVCCDK